jgi:hypothetical protein
MAKHLFKVPVPNCGGLYNEVALETDFKESASTYLRVADLELGQDLTLLRLTHLHLNTILDFTAAADYKIQFLDKIDFVTGTSFAINNTSQYLVQTQSKNILFFYLGPDPATKAAIKDRLSARSPGRIFLDNMLAKAPLLDKVGQSFVILRTGIRLENK